MSSGDGGDPMKVSAGGATVRMYNTGLGECFLIAFAGDDGHPRHIMIDCGTFRGSRDGAARMKRVVEDVAGTTGRRIDVLVVTHAHWDRVSGFVQAREQFQGIAVERVWLSWLENPSDPLARSLSSTLRTRLVGLAAAERRLESEQIRAETQGRPADAGRVARAVAGVREALDEVVLDDVIRRGEDAETAEPTARPVSNSERAMDVVRRLGNHVQYLGPGEQLEFPGASYVNACVLGPPRDLRLLRMTSPPAGGGGSDAAARGRPGDAGGSPPSSSGGDPDLGSRGLFARSPPFDPLFAHRPDSPGGGFLRRLYEDPSQSWRRIDSDWLTSAGRVARDLDSATNNKSLVLAFELGKGGPVLLFPGDAQIGSWLSWDSVSLRGTTAADLLARTAVYKVSHHGSHLGTPREALDRMTHPGLVAMIAVDEAEARKPKGGLRGGWDMPYQPLLRHLRERTRGRVVRADQGIPMPDEISRLVGQDQRMWEAFKQKSRVVLDTDGRPFYVEYAVSP